MRSKGSGVLNPARKTSPVSASASSPASIATRVFSLIKQRIALTLSSEGSSLAFRTSLNSSSASLEVPQFFLWSLPLRLMLTMFPTLIA